MEPQDHTQNDQRREPDAPPEARRPTGGAEAAQGPQVIGTDDPVVASGPAYPSDWKGPPDQTTVIETNRIRAADQMVNPNLVLVPIETPAPPRHRSGAGDGAAKKNGNANGKEKDGKNPQSSHEPKGKDKDASDHGQDDHDDQDKSGGHHEEKHGHGAQTPSLTRTLIYAGVVALVCGIAGAAGYSCFFGPSRSGDQKSSTNGSDSGKSSDSGKGSDSSNGSDAGKSSKPGEGSSSNSNSQSSRTEPGKEQLHQAETAWLAVVKELQQAKASEQDARRSEEELKAILSFLKKTLLAAGRSGDGALVEAFWSGGQGKDIPLSKALDLTESQVAEEFADRPLAEATVREMLGQAYLNVGEPAKAVAQYERALSLREAIQGPHHSETAACRNQLAVAYRLAGRPAEASRLFHRNPDATAQASALSVRGALLLSQKKPAEAELELRQCLTIRRKIQPDDWTTFDTQSILGEALLDQHKFADAEPLLVSGYEGLKQHQDAIPAAEKPRLTVALERLVKLYDSWGKKDEAMKWRKELEAAIWQPLGLR